MLTIAPPSSCFAMIRAAACAAKKQPFRLTSRWASHCASSRSSARAGSATPALLTSTSSPPSAAAASSSPAVIASTEATSSTTGTTLPGKSGTVLGERHQTLAPPRGGGDMRALPRQQPHEMRAQPRRRAGDQHALALQILEHAAASCPLRPEGTPTQQAGQPTSPGRVSRRGGTRREAPAFPVQLPREG